jgi:hypothetical protein
MTVTLLCWGSDELALLIALDPAGPASLLAAGEAATLPGPDRYDELAHRALPLVEVQTTDGGRLGTSGKRHVDGALARGLRCTGHDEDTEGGTRTLRVRMADDTTGLRVTARYTLRGYAPARSGPTRSRSTPTPSSARYRCPRSSAGPSQRPPGSADAGSAGRRTARVGHVQDLPPPAPRIPPALAPEPAGLARRPIRPGAHNGRRPYDAAGTVAPGRGAGGDDGSAARGRRRTAAESPVRGGRTGDARLGRGGRVLRAGLADEGSAVLVVFEARMG